MVPRGAGTSLSGGALPLADGVLLGMAKFNRIREIDFANRVAVVEPGVTNLAITQAVEHAGFYYAPDPSSQIACTIGGNVAENSGGVHCLKYGMTTNNRARLRDGADDRRDRPRSAASISTPAATISSASSPARKACSASSPRSLCAS